MTNASRQECSVLQLQLSKTKKTERGTSKQWKGDPALSYNGAKTAIRKHSFKSSAINGWAKAKKKRNCGHADGERRIKDEHLKLLVQFYFTKIIKNKS